MMEQNFAGREEGKAGEVERPGWRAWQESREEPGEGQFGEAKFLKGLDSPQESWQKEPGPWEDAKAFLASFEHVAEACQWPREEWAARLLPALKGEAQEALRSLEARDREDYGKVKAAILRREANRMEALRQHFRQFRSREVEDPRRIYGQLQELCCRWLRPERHSKEQILELLILEQFLSILPPELQSWIRAGSPENCTQAAALVDDFLMSQQKVAETRTWQASETLEATGGTLQRTEQHLNQDRGQRPMIWQVLPDTGGERDSSGKGALLVPGDDLPFHLGKKEDTSLWFSEEREQLSDQSLGDAQGSQFTVEHPSYGRDKPEKNQGDVQGTDEIQVELCESPREWRKELRWGQTESQGLSGGLGAVCGQTHSKCRRKGKHLFSRYGRRYHLTSRLVTELTRGDWNERATSEEDSDLDVHRGSSEGEKFYQSPVGQIFPEGATLLRNPGGHVGEEERRRPESEESFTLKTLMRHLEIQRGQLGYVCPLCGRTIKTKRDTLRHMRTHTGEKPFKCPKCAKRFSRKDNLSNHRRNHENKRPFKCPQCKKGFFRRCSMLKHQRSHK
ncbi:uncharacterized protein LOC143834035 [Paroedura picta]|uniref:uncharacterized protein LOC143834035 n=1 Tax=Paroedura picta TaxID=143630 RepID=UPI0040577BEA